MPVIPVTDLHSIIDFNTFFSIPIPDILEESKPTP